MKYGFLLGALALPMLAACGDGAERHVDKLTYHVSASREGWNDEEKLLTPEVVASADFGELWQSEELDYHEDAPPRLFASPLYVSNLKFREGEFAGRKLPVSYVVTTTGYAYAILAGEERDMAAGRILWRKKLTETPCQNGQFGNLSTPVIDLEQRRIYVTSCRDEWVWDAHALDLETGEEVAGWPVEISDKSITQDVNRNGDTRFIAGEIMYQRGALNLSNKGDKLYVAFGPDLMGWLVSVDTKAAKVASAFSSMPRNDMQQGGMWGSSGPAVDEEGRIFIATGASFLSALQKKGIPGVYPDSDGAWGQSILAFRDDAKQGLTLTGHYSPFNYCQTAAQDIDIASSGAVAFNIGDGTDSSGQLLALGAAKQGVAYLLDRAAMPGGTKRRAACSTNLESDKGLITPYVQPELGGRGPLVVFGPYSDEIGMVNSAKSRSTMAHFRSADGAHYLFMAGSSKTGEDFGTNVAPSIIRVRVMTEKGKKPYLKIDAREETQVLQNPGSPVISSHKGKGAILWVLDPNVPRSVDIYQPSAPGAKLYAFDAMTMRLLWTSGDRLFTSGKYNEPAVVDGMVLVGTDRLQAFGRGGTQAQRLADVQAEVLTGVDAGRALFEERCAACHLEAASGAPALNILAKMPEAAIVEALKTGKMKEMGSGLSDQERGNIAVFVREANVSK